MKYTKICEACGKEFETNSLQVKYCKGPHYFPCPVCGEPVEKKDRDFTRPHKCCSSECSHILRKRNFKKRICVECGKEFVPNSGSELICDGPHYRTCVICGSQFEVSRMDINNNVVTCGKECKSALTKKTNIEKYGIEHPMQSEDIKKKQQDTLEQHYGVRYALQSDELKQRAINSNIDKFGTEWALGNEDVRKKASETMMSKLGVPYAMMSDEVKEKSKETLISRYGVDNPTKSEDIRQKIKQTNVERYGTEFPSQNVDIRRKINESRHKHIEEINKKAQATWLERYGVYNPSKDPKVIKKIADTMFERYGYEHAMSVPEFREKFRQTMMERYGVPWFVMSKEYGNSSNNNIISNIDRKFGDRLKEYDIPYEFEFRLENRSYDFHIPDTNILIEIDPTYTHNTFGNHWGDGINPDYHLKKSELARKHGYRCIHVFEWDNWDDIIELIKKPEHRIYARDCVVMRSVTKQQEKVAKKFIKENHIQGSANGSMSYIYLIYNDEIVMAISIGKARYNRSYRYEILRMCTKKGYQVIGGASKMFKFLTQYMELSSIISYCDLSKFNGDVYEHMGMKLLRITAPNTIWSKEDRYITSNFLKQRGYDQIFHTDYGKGTNNELLMLENGWLPVCDCGQAVYVYE